MFAKISELTETQLDGLAKLNIPGLSEEAAIELQARETLRRILDKIAQSMETEDEILSVALRINGRIISISRDESGKFVTHKRIASVTSNGSNQNGQSRKQAWLNNCGVSKEEAYRIVAQAGYDPEEVFKSGPAVAMRSRKIRQLFGKD